MTLQSIQEPKATIACLRSERSDERELSVIDVERDNQPDQKKRCRNYLAGDDEPRSDPD